LIGHEGIAFWRIRCGKAQTTAAIWPTFITFRERYPNASSGKVGDPTISPTLADNARYLKLTGQEFGTPHRKGQDERSI
jgi:hypothetical protein